MRCGPLERDSLDVLWVRTVLVVMMRVIGVNVHDEMNVIWVLMFRRLQLEIEEWDNCRPVLERNSFPGFRPGVLKGVNVVTSRQECSLWPSEGLERMIRHDTKASNELDFSCTFCHSALRSYTSVLVPKFLSLSLSTT